jgi:hypothetical protein
MLEKLESTWDSLDYPVLLAAARLCEKYPFVPQNEEIIAKETKLSLHEVHLSLLALADAGYLGIKRTGPTGTIMVIDVLCLRARGRRAVGLWPSESQT